MEERDLYVYRMGYKSIFVRINIEVIFEILTISFRHFF